MPKLTCYQCKNTFSDEEAFCPHCGAVRKENAAQAGIRMAQSFAKGSLLGAGIGAAAGLVVLVQRALSVSNPAS